MSAPSQTTVAQAITRTAREIESWLSSHSSSISDVAVVARSEAETIVLSATGWSRLELISHLSSPVMSNHEAMIRSILSRRLNGEPLQYVVGEAPFYGRLFVVRPGCLIPRPETEVLVEMACAWTNRHRPHAHIFDLGTGSGCISLTIALECNEASVTSVDISAAALEIARENQARTGSRVQFVEADGLRLLRDMAAHAGSTLATTAHATSAHATSAHATSAHATSAHATSAHATSAPAPGSSPRLHPDENHAGQPSARDEEPMPISGSREEEVPGEVPVAPINVLVSNPPYVPTRELGELVEEVRGHEPKLALDGGEDGLTFYREIANIGPGFFGPGPAASFFEIGAGQGDAVLTLFRENPAWNGWEFAAREDLNGIIRVIQGIR